MRAQYDEDLEVNPFYLSFKIQQPLLFDNATKKNWIILVPCFGSFTKEKYDDFDFLNHVLVPIFEDNIPTYELAYKTLGNQKIKICESTITVYSKEPEILKKIQILFDETFYNEDEKTYKVYCVSEPLTSELPKIDPKIENGKVFALNSVDDSKSFLWKFMAKRITKIKVDELICDAKSKLQKLESPTVPDCFSIIKELYIISFHTITSHRTYMKNVSKDENLKNSMKLALEMYLCNSLSSTLFAALTDATSEKDEEINKITRAYQNIRASKSGLRFDMCENIPRAKKELNFINKITTPLEICECLRKVIADLSNFRKPTYSTSAIPNNISIRSLNAINEPKKNYTLSKSALMVNSDDLLSALIFLVIKSEIPNWYAYLEYATNFRFASCSRDDEYQYYLTTLEATLEHIRNMGNNTVEEDLVMDISFTLSAASEESYSSNWTDIIDLPASTSRVGAVAYELNQVRQLFKLIESGQTSAVKELIQRSHRVNNFSTMSRRTLGPVNFNNSEVSDHYCHPLCECQAAIVDRKSCQSLVERSKLLSDFHPIPGSKTFDTAETTQKKYSITNHHTQQSTFSLSSVDDKGWNALHKAAYCGQLEILNLLLEYQYLIDSINLEGETPLHLAARRGHQDIIFKLLDIGADISIQTYSGQTALHIAAEYGYSSCVSTLIYFGMLQSGVNINCVNSSGNTPIHIAAMWGYEYIVNSLIENNASVLIKNNKGLRPADVASTRKLTRLIKITAQKQELEEISRKMETPVSTLLRTSNHQSVNTNISRNSKKTSSRTKSKISNDQIPSKELLIINQPQIISDSVNKKIEKLLKVVSDGDLQMLKFLLEISEDMEALGPIDIKQELCHPLCQCTKCHPVQEVIIKSNNQQININSANKEGFRCLHIAAIHDKSTIAKFLLRYGADPNAMTYKLELTPLHLAAVYGSVKVLNLLLQHSDINSNVCDKKMNTPLSYSCIKGKYDVTESLLQNGVFVNTSNHRGNTPLHEAVSRNHIDIVNLLIKYGADLTCTNYKRLSPLDLSKDLNVYFILKNAVKTREIKKNNQLELDLAESGMASLNSSVHTDHNMFNVDTDGFSLCSDISLPSTDDDNEENGTSVNKLFPDDMKLDFSSQLLLDKSDSPTNFVDTSLLERVDKNSKYNYRLIFRDPNSPSISSTNSSK